MRRAVPAFVVVVFALLVGGCSKSGQLEDKIAEQFKKEVNISNVKVKCPGDIKAKKGEEVQCTANGDFTSLGVDTGAITLFVKFEDDNSFLVTDFSAGGSDISISTTSSP